MARQIQLRRGTTTQTNAFTGALAEVTVDTDKDTVVVHDGSTAGGHPLVKTSDLGTAATTPATDYATAAQGALADTAVQPDDSPSFGSITVSGTVDGRDVAADGTKLDGVEAGATADQTSAQIKAAYEAEPSAFTDAQFTKLAGIEASADVTDTANVTSAGALMDSEVTNLAQVKAFDSSDYATAAQGVLADSSVQPNDSPSFGDITVSGTVDGRDLALDGAKLDGIEAGANVTDTANVTAAGALMDSEVTNLAQVKAFDSSDYATDAQGATADAALPRAGGAMTGPITTNSTFDGVDIAARDAVLTSTTTTADAALPKSGGAMTGNITMSGTETVDGRDLSVDGTKLDTIETNADVTDTANVTASGALMDSEVTNLDQVKAFDSSDYATSTQGTTADAALPKAGGTMTGNLILNADPTAALGAATKEYVDTIAAAGLHYHDPVRVEKEGNLNVTYNNGTAGVGATLTNAGTQAALVIDGVTMVVNDRVLVYEQSDATQNGVYTVTNIGSGSTNWVLTRSTDTDSYAPSDPNSFGKGDAFFVLEGAAGAGELYVMNTGGTITFGTTNITFTQVASTAVYSAGTDITLSGTTFNLDSTIAADTTGNAATATALETTRNIAVTGAVTGNANFDGSGNISISTTATSDPTVTLTGAVTGSGTMTNLGNVSIATTATADPTLTLSGDASGSATFTNLGNATLSVTVADDSHNHVISNVDGLQTALDGKQASGTYNTVIGTDSDINTSGSTIIDNIFVTDGVITSMGTRTLTLGDLGYTGATNANYITNNNQLTNGAGYTTNVGDITGVTAGSGLDGGGTSGTVTLSIESDLRGEVTQIGANTSDYYLVGTTTHKWFLDGVEDMRLENDGDLQVNGNVVAYSTTVSDERLKTDIVKIDGALDKVAQLNGYTFTYTADGKKSAGVIAQEVEKVLPSAITESTLPLKMGEDDKTEYKTVQYDQLIGLLVEAVKELKAEVAELKGK